PRSSVFDPIRTRVDLACDDPVSAIEMDVGRAGHTGIEAPNRAQDVNALVRLRAGELLQNRRIEHRFLVWAGVAPRIFWAGVPGGRRQDLVVAQRAVVDRRVMREIAAPSAPEAGADAQALAWCLERRVDLAMALLQQIQPDQPI